MITTRPDSAPARASGGSLPTADCRPATGVGKADLHLHTSYSDGEPSVAALLGFVAARTDLTVIAITDHDTIAGAEVARRLAEERAYPFEIIVGEEVTTRDGHIVGLFLDRAVPPGRGAAATVDAIHAQGGLAFAPHPFFHDRPWRERRTMDSVGRILADLPVDALELDNSTPFLEWANFRARRFNARYHLPALGASDAHITRAIGKSYTLFPGRAAADLYRAIVAGTVAPASRRYSPADLLAYLRYWCGYTTRPGGAPVEATLPSTAHPAARLQDDEAVLEAVR